VCIAWVAAALVTVMGCSPGDVDLVESEIETSRDLGTCEVPPEPGVTVHQARAFIGDGEIEFEVANDTAIGCNSDFCAPGRVIVLPLPLEAGEFQRATILKRTCGRSCPPEGCLEVEFGDARHADIYSVDRDCIVGAGISFDGGGTRPIFAATVCD